MSCKNSKRLTKAKHTQQHTEPEKRFRQQNSAVKNILFQTRDLYFTRGYALPILSVRECVTLYQFNLVSDVFEELEIATTQTKRSATHKRNTVGW